MFHISQLEPAFPNPFLHSPLLPFPLFLGSALLTLTQPTHTHGDPRHTRPCNRQDTHVCTTHGAGQITHGADHIVVHLKMRLSKLIRPLPHHDLLMPHLQTLAFWRRYNNDRPTLSRQTCPCTRTHPNVSLARVLTRSIRLANTHKTYAKYQHGDERPQTDLPFAAHRLQHSMDVLASTSPSLSRRHFLVCSAASLRSFSAAAWALAASASQRASSIRSPCFHRS